MLTVGPGAERVTDSPSIQAGGSICSNDVTASAVVKVWSTFARPSNSSLEPFGSIARACTSATMSRGGSGGPSYVIAPTA